ncbi:MAG: mechanosensitive ion channel family protein [Thermoplasmata archaeon]
MPVRRRRKWTTVLLFVFVIVILDLLLMDYSVIPNYLPFNLDLAGYMSIFIAIIILASTKIWLDLVEPVLVRIFSSKTKSEADGAAIFQIVSYIAWFIALGAVIWVVAGGPEGIGLLSLGLVSAAMIYVLQKPLMNIVGWAVLVYRGIYKLGDRIKVNDVRGYVTSISIMNTTVREFGGWMSGDTFTGRLVSIPNSFILETNVFNYTKDTKLIWDELVVNVTYESDVLAAKRHVLGATEEVAGNFMRKYAKYAKEKVEFSDIKEMMVEKPRVLITLGDSSVKLFAVYFCHAERRRMVKSRIIEAILRRFAEDDRVQIAYPHVEIVPYKHRPFESRAIDVPADDFSDISSKTEETVEEQG